MSSSAPAHLKPTTAQFMMVVLSVYVLVELAIETFVQLPKDVLTMLAVVDTLVCFVFLGDFFYRLYRAENRLAFMKWGWIDLISSIPTLDVLRWGRVVRLVRILRLLRGVRSIKVIVAVVLQSGLKGTFGLVAIVAALLVVFSSVAIVSVEKSADANIKTAGDALWWSVVTMTTVGYGDKYPVTTEGRCVAAFLIITGVGLFGTFTAAIASLLLRLRTEDRGETDLLTEIRLIRAELTRLESRLAKEEAAVPAQFGRTTSLRRSEGPTAQA